MEKHNIAPMVKEANAALENNEQKYNAGGMTFVEYMRAQMQVIESFEHRVSSMLLTLAD